MVVGEVDVFFLPSRNRDLDKLKSKLIMEKGMLDTCDVNISMVCNHCKSLLEETYICNPFESLLNTCITVLLVRLAQTITCTKYLGIKYHDLCFQERNYCYMLAYTTICSTLIDCTKLGASPFS